MSQLNVRPKIDKENKKITKYIFSDVDIKSDNEANNVDETVYLFNIGKKHLKHNIRCSEQVALPYISNGFNIQTLIEKKNFLKPDVIYVYINNKNNLMKLINKLISFQKPIIMPISNSLVKIFDVNNFHKYEQVLKNDVIYFPSYYTSKNQEDLYLDLKNNTISGIRNEFILQKLNEKIVEIDDLKVSSNLHQELNLLKDVIFEETNNPLIKSIPTQINRIQQENQNLKQQITELQEKLNQKNEQENILLGKNKVLEITHQKLTSQQTKMKSQIENHIIDKIRIVDEMNVFVNETAQLLDEKHYIQNKDNNIKSILLKKNKEFEKKYQSIIAQQTEMKSQMESHLMDKIRIIDEMNVFVNETAQLLDEKRFFKNKYENLKVELKNMEYRYVTLEKKYEALKNSKLGKLTLKYWRFKNKGRKK